MITSLWVLFAICACVYVYVYMWHDHSGEAKAPFLSCLCLGDYFVACVAMQCCGSLMDSCVWAQEVLILHVLSKYQDIDGSFERVLQEAT